MCDPRIMAHLSEPQFLSAVKQHLPCRFVMKVKQSSVCKALSRYTAHTGFLHPALRLPSSCLSCSSWTNSKGFRPKTKHCSPVFLLNIYIYLPMDSHTGQLFLITKMQNSEHYFLKLRVLIHLSMSINVGSKKSSSFSPNTQRSFNLNNPI